MEGVRLRLVFDQILSKSQKLAGLKRCWVLLKPEHQTIGDVASYILNVFDLQNACPTGLALYMEGFVLPPFESTSILKDKDIIRVKKKDGISVEIVGVGDGLESLEVVEIVDKPTAPVGMNLLANEEFGKESGGYESEPGEDVDEQVQEDTLHMGNTPEVKTVSKKRKASKELRSSKRKKSRSANVEKCVVVSEDIGKDVLAEHKETLSTDKVGKRKSQNFKSNSKRSSHPEYSTMSVGLFKAYNEYLHRSPDAARSFEPQENGNGNGELLTPSGTKKLPSRSARRKKAKRQWLREKLKTEKKEQEEKEAVKKANQHSEKENDKVSQESLGTENQKNSEELFEKDDNKLKEEHQQQDQDGSDAEDDVIPIMIRPGHIRFESARKVGADQAVQQNHVPVGTFQWNGLTSKKKGQKWGREKAASYKRNDYKNINEESSQVLTFQEETPVNDSVDFDKLPPFVSLPKEGDTIAYRLIELSSSWTPELSSYRVGRISQYDPESNRVTLVPVPECPMICENKTDNDDSAVLPETSTYGEDGSLEIDFKLLLDIRVVNYDTKNSETSVGRVNEACVGHQDAGTGVKPNRKNEAHVSTKENGEVNGWEEINQALNAKKAQLSEDDSWSKKEGSGRKAWSYKALRGSALGRTMALLRAQNGM